MESSVVAQGIPLTGNQTADKERAFMNDQNLRPFNTMSADEHRELSRRGGYASAEARREKKRKREAAAREQAAQELAAERQRNEILAKILRKLEP